MDLMQVFRSFPDRDACIRYLEDLRWGADPRCAHCDSKEVARTTVKGKTGRFNCHSCRSSFSVLSGTLFHKTKIDLRKWFLAIHIVMKAKKGISSYQLARNLSMNVKSAWYMMTRIRKEMEKQEQSEGLLKGIIEADETWVGGKPRKKKGETNKRGRGTKKMTYLGAIERDGRVVVELADGQHLPRQATLTDKVVSFINKVVDVKDAILMTDGFQGYNQLNDTMPHHVVIHKNEFVKNETHDGVDLQIHTNNIEGFWANIKRAWYGTHHHYTRKYAPLYIAETTYKFNHRKSTDIFKQFLCRCFTMKI